jgi:hypothetical protein
MTGTPFPYPPAASDGDWAVYLPGYASIGEVIAYNFAPPPPTGILVPSSTGASAVVHRISGSGGVGSRYRLRAHFGNGLTPPTMPFTGSFQFLPVEASQIGNDHSAGLVFGMAGSTGIGSVNVTVDTVTMTRPRAGAIEIQFNVVSGTQPTWLDGNVPYTGTPPGSYAYWARCNIGAGTGGAPWLITTHRPDTGAPETTTGGIPDGIFGCLTGPDWPYPYFTGGTPAP